MRPHAHAPIAPNARARPAFWLALYLSCLLLWPAPASVNGAEVVIVLSSDAGPYREAQQALAGELARAGHQARAVLLEEWVHPDGPPTADALVAIGTKAAVLLHQQVASRAPLVYCLVADPEGLGLAQGRPAYGVTTAIPVRTQIALITEALPRARALGLLYRSDTDDGRSTLQEVQRHAPDGWQVKAVAINEASSISEAIDQLLAANVDVVWTQPDSDIFSPPTVRSLLLASLRRRVPVYGFSPAFVRAGAILGVGIDASYQGRQAADLLNHLLKSDTPALSSRVIDPHPQIAVNLNVARQLGLTLPASLIRRAVHVFDGSTEGTR